MDELSLIAHRVAPNTFSVAGRLRPVSVRDQLVRAQLFVMHARRRLLRPSSHDPFVVVGAGASGVAAARLAMDHGVPTVIVERNDRTTKTPQSSGGRIRTGAFGPLPNSRTRWLDPSQYDWPAAHSGAGRHPYDPALFAGSPLPWDASSFASDLADNWRAVLGGLQHRPTNPLTVLWGHTLTGLPPGPGGLAPIPVQITDGATGHVVPFPSQAQAVLYAVGFGTEENWVDGFSDTRGPEYWSDDLLSTQAFGVPPSVGGRHRVLISGAGDGALQDYLRVVTRSWEADLVSPARLFRGLGVTDRAAGRVMRAQEEANRAVSWSAYHREEAVLRRLHAEVQVAADEELAANPGIGARIGRALRTPVPEVTLVFRNDYFGHAYPLNRFLVLLVSSYIRSACGQPSGLLPGYRLTAIDSDPGGQCNGAPEDCQRHRHGYVLSPVTGQGPPARGVADVLVIRHGLDQSSLTPSAAVNSLLAPPLSYQTLPYCVFS